MSLAELAWGDAATEMGDFNEVSASSQLAASSTIDHQVDDAPLHFIRL